MREPMRMPQAMHISPPAHMPQSMHFSQSMHPEVVHAQAPMRLPASMQRQEGARTPLPMRLSERHAMPEQGALASHPIGHFAPEHNTDMRYSIQPHLSRHYAPVTETSPARVQEAHHEAMMHLGQGHAPERNMPPMGAERTAANLRHMAAGAFAGSTLGEAVAHHEMAYAQRGSTLPGEARKSGFGQKGTIGLRNVPPSPRYANPRMVMERPGEGRIVLSAPGERLAYRPGVNVFPRSGDRRSGIPGIFDPGGYIRTPASAGTRINQNFIRQQLAMLPDWRHQMALNQRNIVAERSAWPWALPQQPAWYNPFSWNFPWGNQYVNSPIAVNPYVYGNPYLYGNPYGPYGAYPYGDLNPFFGYPYGVYGPSAFWNDWNNYDDWNNWNGLYANAAPYYGGIGSGILGLLGNLFGGPQGVGLGSGGPNDWLSNLLYFSAYSIGGNNYPVNYFAMNGYVPTPFVFNVANGQVWQPGVGYSDYLPDNYRAPITVSAQEVVPQFDARGKIVGYQPQTFFNDAYWDNDAQSYGYYDYRKKFHWVTFPGLSSYAQEYAEGPAPPQAM